MNTSTEPHLDLDEMVAEVAGRPLSERARDHLACCPHCRSELAAWGAASDGVGLLAATEPPPLQFPAHTTHRFRRRVVLTAAASVVVLTAAAGTTWGLTSGGAPATRAALTAVTGCPGLAAASGTLEQIDGTTLTVRDSDGQTVTVTTSSSTTVQAEVTGSARDITAGLRVIVHGSWQGATLAARSVLANPAERQSPRRPGRRLPAPPPRPSTGVTVGIVSDVHAGGFTVTQELAGGKVQVTTSAATAVATLIPAATGQLRTGVRTIAVGQPGAAGSLAALSVEQGATLPMVQTPPSRSSAGTCDPTGVASAIALGS